MAGDPFERHGIDHISPSSLRLFRDAPVVWIGKYLLKARDDSGPGAWRGRAVEAAIDRFLFQHDTEEAIRAMYGQFALDQMGEVGPKITKELNALEDFFSQGREAFGGLPAPFQRQAKIELQLPGISVPLTGYIDWLWRGESEHGIDLKTTWKIPSKPDPAHVEQVACYSVYTGLPFSLYYVSNIKWSRHEIIRPVADEAYDRVIECARALRSFLAHVEDGLDALSMFAPDYTDFHFKPPMVEAIRNAKAITLLPKVTA